MLAASLSAQTRAGPRLLLPNAARSLEAAPSGHDREVLRNRGGAAVLACTGPVPHLLLALKTYFLPEMWSHEMSPAGLLDLGPVSWCKSGLSSVRPCLRDAAARVFPTLPPACWCRVACTWKGRARRGGKGALSPTACQKGDLALACWLLSSRHVLSSSLTWLCLLRKERSSRSRGTCRGEGGSEGTG